MKKVLFRNFTSQENEVWSELFLRQKPLRPKQMHPLFEEGIKKLEISERKIPSLEEVNEKLSALTGFKGVPVEGLENGESFFDMLERREFPIGNFIRDARDLSYTPAPDIFHDLYGHLPFLASKEYADFSQKMGQMASCYLTDPRRLKMWERLYWFGVEFTLIKTPVGRRIFGAGIASSFGECAFALSDAPELRPFNLLEIRDREYRIDEMQKVLYELNSCHELYSCLEKFDDIVKFSS